MPRSFSSGMTCSNRKVIDQFVAAVGLSCSSHQNQSPGKREEERKPPPHAVAAEPSQARQGRRAVGDGSAHVRFNPPGRTQELALKRGSQDSNLGPAVLETAATTS